MCVCDLFWILKFFRHLFHKMMICLLLLIGLSQGVKLKGTGLTISSCEGTATAITSSSCYQNRYLSAGQYDAYPNLLKLSQSFYDAKSKLTKGVQYIGTIAVPQVSDVLAAALMRAVIDLALNTSDAQSQLSQNVISMKNAATSVTNAMADEFKRVSGTFQAGMQQMLQADSNYDTGNVNQLILRANTLNYNLSSQQYTSGLSDLTNSGAPILLKHSANVTDLVNQINDGVVQAPSTFTLALSKFATDIQSLLNQLLTSQNLKTSGIQNSTISDITNRMNNLMVSLNATGPGISSIVTQAQTDLNTAINSRRSNVWNQLRPLNISINSVMQAWQTAFNSSTNSIATLLNSTSQAQVLNYTGVLNLTASRTSSLRSGSIPNVSNWEINANARLGNLQQQLTDGTATLLKSLSGNQSSDLWSNVNMQMAQAASTQQAISDALSAAALRQESSLQDIITRMGKSGTLFQQVLSQIMSAQNALKTEGGANLTASGDSAMGKAFSVLSFIQSSFDGLSKTVLQMAQDADKNMALARVNATALVTAYDAYIDSLTSNGTTNVSNLIGLEGDSVSQTSKMWDDFLASIDLNTASYTTATIQALNSVQLINSTLAKTSTDVSGLISETLAGLASAMSAVMQSVSGTSFLIPPTPASPANIAANDPSPADLLAAFLAATDKSNSKNQAGLQQYSANQESQIALIQSLYSTLSSLVSSLSDKSKSVSYLFSNASIAGEQSLNSSLSALNASGYGIPDIQSAVSTGLSSSISIASDVSDLSSRVLNGNGTLTASASQLDQLINSMTKQSKQFAGTSNNSLNYIMDLVGRSGSANSILAQEIATLIGSIQNASSTIDSDSSSLLGFVDSNTSSIANQTLAEQLRLINSWTAGLEALKANISSLEGIVSVIPITDANMKSTISVTSSNVDSLTSKLTQSAGLMSAEVSSMMNALLATATSLKARLNGISNDTSLESLQGILNGIASTVASSGGRTIDQLSNMTSTASRSILGSLAGGVQGMSQDSGLADQMLSDAKESIQEGTSAIGSIGSIMSSSAQERSNSASSVVNSISSNQAKIDGMLKSALRAASDSPLSATGSNTSVISDFPAFFATVGNQLAAFSSYMSSVNGHVASLSDQNSQGIRGEETIISAALKNATSFVDDALNNVGTANQEIEQVGLDLEDSLNRLNVTEANINNLISGITGQVPDMNVPGVAAQAVTGNVLNSTLQTDSLAFADLESSVDGMIRMASSTG